MTTFTKDSLQVKILTTAEKMGAEAAKDIYGAISELLEKKDEINIIFAAAPSQNTTLDALLTYDIDWSRINAFHMDEYIGLKFPSASFQMYLRGRIFDKVNFKSVNFINAQEEDIEKECKRYSELLEKNPTDIVILGIGENGHIAFNDPPVADFNDSALVKPVKLDDKCRNQQVHDGCFEKFEDVPQYALTLTVPALLRAKKMFCVVPYTTKAEAVREMLTTDKIDEHCPATALRNHGGATLYCDGESSSLLRVRIKSENIILPDGILDGFVYTSGSKIVAVTNETLPFDIEQDYGKSYVMPGLVELHSHGAAGFDYGECETYEADIAMEHHLKNGATTYLPTLSNSIENIKTALSRLEKCKAENFAGVHIEGPYFAPAMCGGQNPEFITAPIEKDYTEIAERYADIVKRWSYAPEREGADKFCRYIKEKGIIPSAGHTEALYSDMQTAFENGCNSVTHLYSCTSTVTRVNAYRRAGVLEYALLNDEMTAELIADGSHLPPELIRLVFKVKPRDKITLTTDSLKVCGTDEKEGTLAGIDYVVEDGVCKKSDRTSFVGSIATANILIKTCVNAGIDIVDSVYCASAVPADLLGIKAGRLQKDYAADIAVMDGDFNVIAVYKNGVIV